MNISPLATLFGKAIYGHRPMFASLELTYACNLHCKYCYNPVDRKGQEREKKAERPRQKPLSYEEIIDLQNQLRDMGVFYFTLTGGEPLLHPRFWDIARAAKDRAFALRIFTNATLVDEEAADRLHDLCPYCLEITVHGATPETAEAVTGVSGSFEKQQAALSRLRDRGVRVFMKCTVTRLLEKELPQIKAMADRFGFPIYFDPVITLSDDGCEYPLRYAASDDAIRSLYTTGGINLGNSPFERTPGEMNCTVATGNLHIDPFGNLQPCVQWKESIDNIRNRPVAEIWETNPRLKQIREMNAKVLEDIKGATPHYDFCLHCPGLSLLRYGDPTRPEEQYLRVARIRSEIRDAGNGAPDGLPEPSEGGG